MENFSSHEIWYGRNTPPPERIPLQSGSLDLVFQDGDLRYVRFGNVELIRRVYVAIRDHNWNTIPGTISDLSVKSESEHFSVQFNSHHRTEQLDFTWQALITGSTDGKISYTMDGITNTEFRYCRIGFCILHPIQECAGRPYQALTPHGEISGTLPVLIGPQRMEGNFEAPLFPSCSSLSVQLENGMAIHTDFEGDLFEMEDQRNWTDGSFKTYCTPLSLGYPHTARAGQQFHQKVTIWLGGEKPASRLGRISPPGQVDLSAGKPIPNQLPKVGFGISAQQEILSQSEARLLSRLRPDHLKVEVHFTDANWKTSLGRAIQTAEMLHTSLEAATFLSHDPAQELQQLKSQLSTVSIARFIIFHESEAGQKTTSRTWLELARAHLGTSFPGVPITGGTNGNFAELNRDTPDISVMDGVSYTINPQVHSWDEASMVEALEAQASTVTTARNFCGSVPIIISSVTLKPPFNQAATEQEAPPRPGELPSSVDPRQMSLFGAAWTLGSFRSLAVSGADSITYYEIMGWRGLMETAQGSLIPDRFRSLPGMIFPVYHIFADLAEAKHAQLIPLESSRPLSVTGFILQSAEQSVLLCSNLQPVTHSVRIGPLMAREATLRRLNDQTAGLALFEPDRFRTAKEPFLITEPQIVLTLQPYETIRIDL